MVKITCGRINDLEPISFSDTVLRISKIVSFFFLPGTDVTITISLTTKPAARRFRICFSTSTRRASSLATIEVPNGCSLLLPSFPTSVHESHFAFLPFETKENSRLSSSTFLFRLLYYVSRKSQRLSILFSVALLQFCVYLWFLEGVWCSLIFCVDVNVY